jgi:hypothetical protein
MSHKSLPGVLHVDHVALTVPDLQLVASFEADFVQSGRTSQRRKSMSGTER